MYCEALEAASDVGEVGVHLVEVGELVTLLPVVALGHGVGDVLDDGEVGHSLLPLLATHLAPRDLEAAVVLGAGQLDGQAQEGGQQSHLG